MNLQRAKALLMRDLDATPVDEAPAAEPVRLPIVSKRFSATHCEDCGEVLNKRRLRCSLELCLPCAINLGREQNGLPRVNLTKSGAPTAQQRKRRTAT